MNLSRSYNPAYSSSGAALLAAFALACTVLTTNAQEPSPPPYYVEKIAPPADFANTRNNSGLPNSFFEPKAVNATRCSSSRRT
jgi:hypothetical protein